MIVRNFSLEDAIAWYGEPESAVGLFYPGIFTGSKFRCATQLWGVFDTGWHEGLMVRSGWIETHVTSIHYIDMDQLWPNSAGFVCPEVSNYSIVSDWHGYGIYQTCNQKRLIRCGDRGFLLCLCMSIYNAQTVAFDEWNCVCDFNKVISMMKMGIEQLS